MRIESLDLRNALAAEYVVGTLNGLARRRLERQMLVDKNMRETVAQWESYLVPLAENVQPVNPPGRIWQVIESRINARNATKTASGWWERVAFWRNLGLATSGLAAALLFAFISLRPAVAEPEMVAVLTTPESVPRMIIEQQKSGELLIKMVNPWAAMPDQSLELWVIPKAGAPRSLGVVPHDRDSRVQLANLSGKLADGTAFAISREPKGGSPTGAPTGPVLCSGAIARIRV